MLQLWLPWPFNTRLVLLTLSKLWKDDCGRTLGSQVWHSSSQHSRRSANRTVFGQVTFKVLIIIHVLIRDGNGDRVIESVNERPSAIDASRLREKSSGNCCFLSTHLFISMLILTMHFLFFQVPCRLKTFIFTRPTFSKGLWRSESSDSIMQSWPWSTRLASYESCQLTMVYWRRPSLCRKYYPPY